MNFKVMPLRRCSLPYVRGLPYLGKGQDPRTPTKLMGSDPDLCQRLIDSLNYKHPFTSIALNYAATDAVTDEDIRRDIAAFQAALLPGLIPGVDYDAVWFKHFEYPKIEKPLVDGAGRPKLDKHGKPRLERVPDLTAQPRITAHGIIPNVLHTADGGRRLQPYWHVADGTRMIAWQELTNHERGYASTLEPERRRKMSGPNNTSPAKVKDAKEALHSDLLAAISAGQVRTEAVALAWLKQKGFTIKRRQKGSISVTHPDHKRPIRLEGELYEKGGIERVAAGAKITPSVPRIDVAALRKSFDARIEHKRGVFQAQLARARRSAERAAERENAAAAKRDHEARANAEITAGTVPVVVVQAPQPGATDPATPTLNHENDIITSARTTGGGPAPFPNGDGFARIADAIEQRARETARRIGGIAEAIALEENRGWEIRGSGVATLAAIDGTTGRARFRLGAAAERIRTAVRRVSAAVRSAATAMATRARSLYLDGHGIPGLVLPGAAVARLGRLLKRHRPTPHLSSIDELAEAIRELHEAESLAASKRRPSPPDI